MNHEQLRQCGSDFIGLTAGEASELLAEFDAVVAAARKHNGKKARLRDENERLRSALKVICTWGRMDIRNPEFTPHLVAEDVVALCDKALGSQNITD